MKTSDNEFEFDVGKMPNLDQLEQLKMRARVLRTRYIRNIVVKGTDRVLDRLTTSAKALLIVGSIAVIVAFVLPDRAYAEERTASLGSATVVQSDATGPFLGRLLAIAEASKREEDDFRKSTAMARLNITEANFGQESQRHLEALTAVRVGAYRRYYLLKGMAEAVRTPATSEGVVPAALDFVLGETGWSPADAGYAEVREQLKDAARAVEAALQAEAQAASGGEAEAGGGDAPIEACYRFEAWYRERFGSEFLERLEAKRAFLSVADF